VPLEELGRKWKKQLMFQDPFIRGFLNPSNKSRPTTANTECTSNSVLRAYDITLGETLDATRSTMPAYKGSQTERSWRTKASRVQRAKHQETGFCLRQHVNDQQIPEYDAILDQHAKFVENPSFAEHVEVTRPLTPEHSHILNNRIKMKENADLAVMALTGVTVGRDEARATSPPEKRTQGRRSVRSRLHSARSAGTTLGRREEPELEHEHAAEHAAVDWADSPLMEFVLDETGLDAAGMASPAARQVQQEEEEGFDSLFNAAEVRIERLWEEVCFPDIMRNKFRNTYMALVEPATYATLLAEITCLVLYRRTILQVLQAIWHREQELRQVLQEASSPEHLWQLRKLTVVCLEAIEQWKRIFPWNQSFVYRGQDYILKTNADLSLLKSKLNSSLQSNHENQIS